ncbi:MAG: serine--tRNA ligase [Deltaproteobacteria bacterium]|nr:serine--tRNA ligase [Deltaproteobacteria bacterium]
MLDIKYVRAHPEVVKTSIQRRNLNAEKINVDHLLDLDTKWREAQSRANDLRGQRNELSSSIKKLAAEERKEVINKVKGIKGELTQIEKDLEDLATERDVLLRLLPNLLADDVPDGKTDEENVEVSHWGQLPTFDFEPRDHVALGEITDTIDFDRAAKVTGSNFYYLKHEAVLLEQALCSFATAHLLPEGFIPITTPDLARSEVLEGIGFAPRGPEKQVYNVEETDLSLVGTAEITVGGYHSGEIFDADTLPLSYLGFSHCFRTEAGAYGKESRGLYRVHQFTKAEMFVLCEEADSTRQHERIRAQEEALLQELGIPYRVVNVCAGDLGAPALKKYDIEAWMPGRSAYGEVTSCSNCTDYQARRLNIRYRPEPTASPKHVHMLNGTAIAISRTLIAILENFQRADGSVSIPKALHPFTAGVKEIPCRR